jgi:hypothetical protein
MITASGSDNSSEAGAAVMPKLPVIADTKGRLRVTKAQRREILTALARSGESLPRFAQRSGLKYSTLARWVQVRRAKPAGRKPALRLLEALVESAPLTATGTVLVLPLPGNVRLEVADEKQAALAAILLRGLAKSC